MGFLGTIDLLSKRCLGAARQPTAGPQKQAAPLTVAELGALHRILASEKENIWDRHMAGAFLCCLYTRSRWSDFQHSNLLATDPNDDEPHFLEMSIVDFKTKSANAWRLAWGSFGSGCACSGRSGRELGRRLVACSSRDQSSIVRRFSSHASSGHGRAGNGETIVHKRGI